MLPSRRRPEVLAPPAPYGSRAPGDVIVKELTQFEGCLKANFFRHRSHSNHNEIVQSISLAYC